MLSTPPPPRQHSPLTISTQPQVLFSDARSHGYIGPTRSVRMARAAPNGGGTIAKCEDGVRCAVAGKDSLKIMRLSEPTQYDLNNRPPTAGRVRHRIDASRNFWDGSGLKISSASTDIAWGHGPFNNKILTSARNGELIMWDVNKAGSAKYERRTRAHVRSINKLSLSRVVPHYCVTGSSDSDLRVWDLRDMSKSIMTVHFANAVRSVVLSPTSWLPLHAMVGLDNGCIYRWDLKMAQRGQLDRLSVAHSSAVTTLDWCNATTATGDILSTSGNGHGWVASGGLDKCVKIWDLTAPGGNTHIPHEPTYTLHPSFPVRRVLWRPSYQCEIAIVSNAEFATGSMPDMAANAGSPRIAPSHLATEVPGTVPFRPSSPFKPEAQSLGGDAVEIWDVRRGWIAKWNILGSAIEGGVVDIAFKDSHAIWTQHSSGLFAQIDLRESIKPLDPIPRSSAAWEVSGALAFAADRPVTWETPYDDINPMERVAAEVSNVKMKAPGDRRFIPSSQIVGAYVPSCAEADADSFSKLARGYLLKADNQIVVCETNAQVALEAGREEAAQVWMLIASLLSDLPPEEPSPALSELSELQNPFPPALSAPAAIPASYASTARSIVNKPTSDFDSVRPSRSLSTRGPSVGKMKRHRSDSASRHGLTPPSSNNSSPRHYMAPLPPITPRQSSFMGRRESADGMSKQLQRRMSMSTTPSTNSASPSERPNLRNVGEGALDSSDSSSGSGGDDGHADELSDEDTNLQPLISPALLPLRVVPNHPSPLSRVLPQEYWHEHDADEDMDNEDVHSSSESPSPQSTDTDSPVSDVYVRRNASTSSSSRRKSAARAKTRSRSSTLASLAAAPSIPRRAPLKPQNSRSSIRTVTVADLYLHPKETHGQLEREETIRDLNQQPTRQKLEAVSHLTLDENVTETADPAKTSQTKERKRELIRSYEEKHIENGWSALREALEEFADEGDVQMCAMLCVIVPKQLRVRQRRILQFLESYIEQLTRLRLHIPAGYLRKYSGVERMGQATTLSTTIYTSCARCRKALAVPVGAQSSGYHYCATCRSNCTICSVCRLPVRKLLFTCSVCGHGGHQTCYRKYYMGQPMAELPGSSVKLVAESIPHVPERTPHPSAPPPSLSGDTEDLEATPDVSTVRSETPISPSAQQLRKLWGHPCAAGCGHFCWAANSDR